LNCLKDRIKTDREREFVEDLFFIKKEGNKCAHGEDTTAMTVVESLKRAFEASINYAYAIKHDEKIDRLQFDETLLMTQKPLEENKIVEKYVELAQKSAQEYEKEEKLRRKQEEKEKKAQKTKEIKEKIKQAKKNLQKNVNFEPSEPKEKQPKKTKKYKKDRNVKKSKNTSKKNKSLKPLLFGLFVLISLCFLAKMIFFISFEQFFSK